MKPPKRRDRKDAIAIILDLDEKGLRRVLVAVTWQIYEPAGIDARIFEEILDEAER